MKREEAVNHSNHRENQLTQQEARSPSKKPDHRGGNRVIIQNQITQFTNSPIPREKPLTPVKMAPIIIKSLKEGIQIEGCENHE